MSLLSIEFCLEFHKYLPVLWWTSKLRNCELVHDPQIVFCFQSYCNLK